MQMAGGRDSQVGRIEGISKAQLLTLWLTLFAVMLSFFQPHATAQVTPIGDILPEPDLPKAVHAARYMAAKIGEANELAIDSVLQGTTPAELRGLTKGIVEQADGVARMYPAPREFEGGNDLASIAEQMFQDLVQSTLNFYSGYSEWRVNGVCVKNIFNYYIYQEYYYPFAWGEISSDPLRGEYLERNVIRALFERMLHDGPLMPIATRDEVLFPGDAFELADGLAPYDIERARALTEPDSEGRQPRPLERTIEYIQSIASKGSIPSTPDENGAFHGNEFALKRGEVSEHFRNLEFHRFTGLGGLLGDQVPMALPNCHKPAEPLERTFPYVHRSDNPLIFPYTRSPAHQDLLLLLHKKADKILLSTTPGACLGHDLSRSKGLTMALGAHPLSERFGMLSEVNRGLVGNGLLANHATKANCLEGAGSIYPLTNRIAGGKNFEANFYTRFLRADKLTGLYSDNALPSFHREKRGGSRYASKLEVVRSSFGSTSPRVVQPGSFEDPWELSALRGSDGYDTRRRGGDTDRAVYTEWTGYNCCPKGYSVLVGPRPQIKKMKKYKGDGWN